MKLSGLLPSDPERGGTGKPAPSGVGGVALFAIRENGGDGGGGGGGGQWVGFARERTDMGKGGRWRVMTRPKRSCWKTVERNTIFSFDYKT